MFRWSRKDDVISLVVILAMVGVWLWIVAEKAGRENYRQGYERGLNAGIEIGKRHVEPSGVMTEEKRKMGASYFD